MVMTTAHVVAGVSPPMVELPGEPARDGQVVYFDPVDDLAVIAADVQAPPLPLTDAAAGDSAVVHGYPYGGPPSTVPAGVAATGSFRSEERRVGKERRARWAPEQCKKRLERR